MTSKTPAQQWADKKRRLAALKPSLSKFTICDDSSLRIHLAEAKAELADAEDRLRALPEEDEGYASGRVRVETAALALSEAQATFDAAAITLTFRSLNRDELKELEAKHPPTEQDEADGADFADTFMPELISAASMDHMPVDDARAYLDTWPPAESGDLWAAAWGVQHSKRTDLGKG